MNPTQRLQTLTQYQTYCVIPIIVLNVLPHHHAIDAQHARNAALFRLVVSVLGLVGVIALEIKKQALKKQSQIEAAQQPPPQTGVWPPPPGAS